jgi:PAS domain S-box-containing protein
MNSTEQAKFFLTLLNKVNDAIIATNNYGHLLFFNKAAQAMTGFPEKLHGLDWLDYMAVTKPDRKTKIEKRNHPVLRALRDERLLNEELFLTPKNKMPRAILINGSPIVSNGIKDGVIIIIQDITSQKETESKLNSRSKSLIEAYEGLRRAETGLRNTNTELEKRVLERTQHLTRINKELQNEIQIRSKAEQQIKRSNAELIKINKDLDNFIYTASHDLRAPISNIEGLINALKEEKSYNEDSTKYLIDLMYESVEKFKNTIADLTEISKIQKAEGDFLEIVSFENIFLETQTTIHDLISTTNTKIDFNFTECPEISFSRKNLRSIFYNLISNSIKYAYPQRNPELTLKTERNNKYCILTVTDNGMGIADDKINRIFSMFKRLHDHVEGSGIGLYIVKRIMENADGKIEVTSEIDKGTEFKLFFPLFSNISK